LAGVGKFSGLSWGCRCFGDGGHPVGAIVGVLSFGGVGAHVHLVGDSGEGQHISGQQCSANDSLSIHAGTVCAAEVADVDESVGFDEHAVLF